MMQRVIVLNTTKSNVKVLESETKHCRIASGGMERDVLDRPVNLLRQAL